MVWIRKSLVTVDIYYYMPDYADIIQEFIWQTEDVTPEIPRVHKFLDYWKHNIDAIIKEINVSYADQSSYRSASFKGELKWH